MAHAEAYKEPGTPEEQSRRTFMANVVIALGGVIGISLPIPLVASLIPAADATNDQWSGLTPEQANALKKATSDAPVKVTFNVHETNGYFGAADNEQFVWAVRALNALGALTIFAGTVATAKGLFQWDQRQRADDLHRGRRRLGRE